MHEYGGGAYLVHLGTVYFSNYDDQRLYCQPAGQPPQSLNTPVGMRFAEAVFDRWRHRLIAVCEDHSVKQSEPLNSIVSIALDGSGRVSSLASGYDFYCMPKISADGKKLAWLSWRHPNMPWDGTDLFVAEFDEDGALQKHIQIAGGETESVLQPEWSPDGHLYFISDRHNWWNLYRHNAHGAVPDRQIKIESLYEDQADFAPGMAPGLLQLCFYLCRSNNLFVHQGRLVASG